MERSHLELLSIQKLLKVFPHLANQLSRQEFKQICTITIIESWDRGQIIFAETGFYLILKGTVRPYAWHSTVEALDPSGPTIGVGGSFGSLEAPDPVNESVVVPCMMTQESCEILKISHCGFAKLKQDIQSENYAMKEALIQGCQFYLQWPKLSIDRLAALIQMRTFPANHGNHWEQKATTTNHPPNSPYLSSCASVSPVMVYRVHVSLCLLMSREGKVCSFVAFIREGECNVLQDVHTVIKTPLEKRCQSVRIKSVVVGKLGPMESFGEVSILLDQPSPCSIVTATEVQFGILQPEDLKALDQVTTSLMLQTAQPTYGNLSQEEIHKDYLRQERRKEWEHIKKKVLNDSLFYNGIQEGVGKWTFWRGATRPDQKKLPEL
ncbi:cyclic nucleotide-binding domain-containing protein 1 [Aplochiton taeniatus]